MTGIPAGLVIRRVPLSSLRPDPANARAHPELNLAAISASLARFGQAEPLVVQKRTQRIVGGHGRLAARKALGWTECDIVELDIDDLQATALGIALNRTAEMATWDDKALTKLLAELQAQGALDGVGFDTAEIDEMIAALEAENAGPVDDPGPEPPSAVAVARRGETWILGSHRLMCGDSTNAEE